jgi:hypothetical protein
VAYVFSARPFEFADSSSSVLDGLPDETGLLSWGVFMFPFWSDVPLAAWLQMSAMFVAIVCWVTGLLATTPGRP